MSKKQSELLAAKFSVGAGMMDLMATALKGVTGESALAFQTIKVAGGLLTGMAAVVTLTVSTISAGIT